MMKRHGESESNLVSDDPVPWNEIQVRSNEAYGCLEA
jgi:hypothetical protein